MFKKTHATNATRIFMLYLKLYKTVQTKKNLN